MVRGFSRFVLFLFLGLLRAPTRNSPERVRDTIWTFPEKSGKLLREGEGQSEAPGGGGDLFFIENPRRGGGFQDGRGRRAGRASAANWGSLGGGGG